MAQTNPKSPDYMDSVDRWLDYSGLAWLIGQGGAVTTRGQIDHDLTTRLFPFLLLTRLISLPIFSLVFFVTLHTERQNQTYAWLHQLPIEPLQWHIVKLLTASFLCILVMTVGLGLASGVLYWYISDAAAEPIPFFTTFWLIARHLLLLPIVVWLTLYGMALFMHSPIVAVLTLLVLQMVGGFASDSPNPFASLRLALAQASALYQPEVVGLQYLVAATYCTFLLLIGWLLSRWRPTWLIRLFSH